MITLYILINQSNDLFYIGTTNNLERRIKEHNADNNHFTGKFNHEWKVIFTQEYEQLEEARKEERRLKKAKNKRYIQWYIKNKGR